jgi:DNA-binding CsgD family transcriptional regulator
MKARKPGYQRNRGERQENRIVEILAGGGLTSRELADRLHLSHQRTHIHLKRMRKRPNRRVRVMAYELTGGRPQCVYELGSGQDVSIGAYQQRRIVDMLIEIPAPWSAYQIAERLSMGYGSVKVYMRALKKARKIYVARWIWSNKTPMPLYAAGKGENVPKPTKRPLPPAQVVVASQGIFAALGI